MKKKIVVIGSIIIIIGIGIGVITTSIKAKANEAVTEVATETISLEKQDLEKVISVTGTIASNSIKVITSEVTDVKITELNVAVGDFVKKGDIIARLDSSNLIIKLNAAQTALDVAKQKSKIEIDGATRNTQNIEITRNIEIERSNTAVAQAYKEYAEAVAKKDTTYQEYQNAINKKKEKEIAYFGAKGSADNSVKETEIRRKAVESAQISYDAELEAYELAVKESVLPGDTVKLA
ncbi:MAG: biotin/lipoyl-binding protein [Clostridiales bacterium]|nr:biotin/lipoyl-binding protein [Clostridiales bacterium]